jgi:polyhydroxyalkanoate synthase
MEIGGERLDLAKITLPVYLQSAKDDHIAPFASVYKSTGLLGGPVRFILAGSGHIAGVVNPPAAKKYQYWTNESVEASYPPTAEAWRASATEHPGSWWPDWDKWLSEKSGEKVPARQPGDGALPVLDDAPGLYVRAKG